jgi:hypothetical protein
MDGIQPEKGNETVYLVRDALLTTTPLFKSNGVSHEMGCTHMTGSGTLSMTYM